MTPPESGRTPDKLRRIISEAAIEDERKGPVVTAPADALRRLGGPHAGGHDQRVRRTLALVERVGRRELADLLYELARACLVVDRGTARADNKRYLVLPESYATLREIVETVATRLRAGLPFPAQAAGTVVTPQTAQQVAQVCLDAAVDVGLPESRAMLLRSELLSRKGALEQALECLEGVESPSDGFLRHVHAKRMALLDWLDRTEEQISVGIHALERFPDDKALLFNLASAHAWLGDHHRFEELAKAFASSPDPAQDIDWLHGHIGRHAAWMGERLGVPPGSICASFGLKGPEARS